MSDFDAMNAAYVEESWATIVPLARVGAGTAKLACC